MFWYRGNFVEHGPIVPGLAPMEAADRLTEYKRLFAER